MGGGQFLIREQPDTKSAGSTRSAATSSSVPVKDSGFNGSTDSLGGVPREQKMLKRHLPRVIHYQVY